MTVYPSAIDDDRTINRIDDNLSELGTQVINQIRDALFSVEKTLGTNPQGSKSSVAERLSIVINPDGTLNLVSLTGLGIATLPIQNVHIAPGAGISESKLALDFSTSTLNTKITVADSQLLSIANFSNEINSNLRLHVAGSPLFLDNSTLARHVASHIDLNAIPTDVRDIGYSWSGLIDKNGNLRSATTVASALLEINNDLVLHENGAANAHTAAAISLDTSSFIEIPQTATTVQAGFDYLDNKESLSTVVDRATMNSNGIPLTARTRLLSSATDGYTTNVVPATKVMTFLSETLHTSPTDDPQYGDDCVKFIPDSNTNFIFDSYFTKVAVGDILRIDYGGIEFIFTIASIRYTPGSEWIVRINGTNYKSLSDGYGYARIDRPYFDTNTAGVLAVASAPTGMLTPGFMESVVVGSPRGATAVGIAFDPNQINSNHYNLYLRLYPNGDPSYYFDLSGIDVSGNAGTTVGAYTIDSVIESTNKAFRSLGYNYRFIAFNHKGQFGIMIADPLGEASFTIISGAVSGTSIDGSSYPKNIIGDALNDGYDALGFGAYKLGLASPVPGTYVSAITAASFSTIIIPPLQGRNAYINGTKRDYLYNQGPWVATVLNNYTSYSSPSPPHLETEYVINQNLQNIGFKPGKTIVIQPENITAVVDGYGRFIIKEVTYIPACGLVPDQTVIRVLNSAHGYGNPDPVPVPVPVGGQVMLSLCDDSVSFDMVQSVGDDGGNTYHRYHEVFINNFAHTFSIERARMVKQVSVGSLLGTNNDNWRIRSVSDYLKGYRDPSNFDRRYVRFTVISESNAEYTARLSDPFGTETGPVVTGKKNIPTKFYDDSNCEYVEIEFKELGTSSTTIGDGYVDIEVFPSLGLDDEFFRLAGVSHNDTLVRGITDLREFGTLSEKNFTNSAIDFIQLGEKYLHNNGIVRGFEYIVANGYSFYFKGGVALVNGKFVSVDSHSVDFPITTGYYTFFICVTENGNLLSVAYNPGENDFFAGTYFSDSVYSMDELVNQRRNLTPIAYVTVNNGTIVGLEDARRFVFGGEGFSWGPSDGSIPASFRSMEAVRVWNNLLGGIEVEFRIKSITSEIVISNLSATLILYGASKIVTVTSARGLVVNGGYLVLRDLVFSYEYTLQSGDSYASVYGDYTNIASRSGCITNWYNGGAVNVVGGLKVENCHFTTSKAYIPPFIGLYAGTSTQLYSIYIRKNNFYGGTYKLAVGIISTSLSAFPNLAPCTIEGNNCGGGAILIAPDAAQGAGPVSGGFTLDGTCTIENNICGMIGVWNPGYAYTCNIKGNICGYISTYPSARVNGGGAYAITGNGGNNENNPNIGSFVITGNTLGQANLVGSQTIIFEDNRVSSSYNTGANAWSGLTSLIPAIAALAINQPGSNLSFKIDKNTISGDYQNGTALNQGYTTGIAVLTAPYNANTGHAGGIISIQNNNISGLIDSVGNTIGILYRSNFHDTEIGIIKSNTITRGTSSIRHYIMVTSNNLNDSTQIENVVTISENSIDSNYCEISLSNKDTIVAYRTQYGPYRETDMRRIGYHNRYQLNSTALDWSIGRASDDAQRFAYNGDLGLIAGIAGNTFWTGSSEVPRFQYTLGNDASLTSIDTPLMYVMPLVQIPPYVIYKNLSFTNEVKDYPYGTGSYLAVFLKRLSGALVQIGSNIPITTIGTQIFSQSLEGFSYKGTVNGTGFNGGPSVGDSGRYISAIVFKWHCAGSLPGGIPDMNISNLFLDWYYP
jgi:hypothetical protein